MKTAEWDAILEAGAFSSDTQNGVFKQNYSREAKQQGLNIDLCVLSAKAILKTKSNQ